MRSLHDLEQNLGNEARWQHKVLHNETLVINNHRSNNGFIFSWLLLKSIFMSE